MMDQYWEKKRDFTIERIGEARFSALKMRSNGTRIDYAAVEIMLKMERAAMGVNDGGGA